MFHYNIFSSGKLFGAIISIVVFSLLFSVTVSASSVITFSEDTTITITVEATAVSLVIPAGSTADEVIVNTSSVEITKGSEGNISITSSGRINLVNNQNFQTACDADKSKVAITVDTKVIITPTSTADYCAANLAGGGAGGGGGGGGGSSGGSIVVTTQPVSSDAETTPETETPPEEEPMFKDIGKLKKSEQEKILQIAELMLEQKTYKVPATKKYWPSRLTNGYLGIQVWNAVAGIGCGSDKKFPGITACKKEAIKAKFIPSSFSTAKKVTRLQNYEVLLNARNISLDETFTGDDLEEICSDVKKGTKKMAQVYFTARANGIAVKYKGSKCKLNLGFSRKDAASFAVKALAAKSPEAPPAE
ncbi:hypothetical protein HYW83_02935 [Candidatus Peregrinibacteria bacterium]|nr:hypothetical protein [Candidatus Peregrinibacteria bacterium]